MCPSRWGIFFYFSLATRYNGGMNNSEYYNNCEKCGRPFPKAKPCQPCTCQFGFGTEYCGKRKGCIRNKDPECPYNCVIASVTVETIDGIKSLADCFVHVTSINTTFYIDDKHRIMTIWAGPVEVEMPSDVQTDEQLVEFVKTFNMRGQFLYIKYRVTELNKDAYLAVYFDKTGKPFWAGDFNEMTEV